MEQQSASYAAGPALERVVGGSLPLCVSYLFSVAGPIGRRPIRHPQPLTRGASLCPLSSARLAVGALEGRRSIALCRSLVKVGLVICRVDCDDHARCLLVGLDHCPPSSNENGAYWPFFARMRANAAVACNAAICMPPPLQMHAAGRRAKRTGLSLYYLRGPIRHAPAIIFASRLTALTPCFAAASDRLTRQRSSPSSDLCDCWRSPCTPHRCASRLPASFDVTACHSKRP